MNARKSSGFSRTNTGPIVTNMNRADATFANEEGEETPIVRLNQGMAHALSDPSRMQATVNNNFLAAPSTRHRTASMPEAVENPVQQDASMHEPWNARSSIATATFNPQGARPFLKALLPQAVP